MNDVPPSAARHRDGVPVLRALSAHDGARQHDLRAEDRQEIRGRDRRAPSTRPRRSCNLTPYLDRLPKALSGGQRQRVAIGRSIVRDPKVYLFDEPLSNLDAALRVATRIEIAQLKESMPESTMIYVTHDQVEAMTLATRIVVLADGGIAQVGTPLDLYERPENEFVAQFIGSPGDEPAARQDHRDRRRRRPSRLDGGGTAVSNRAHARTASRVAGQYRRPPRGSGGHRRRAASTPARSTSPRPWAR